MIDRDALLRDDDENIDHFGDEEEEESFDFEDEDGGRPDLASTHCLCTS